MRALVMRKTVLLLVLLATAFFIWSAMTGNDHRTNDA
ncbi:DSBA oxidoreductase|nr:DSBA oxidoreductase [Candidatus Pantoea persica]